jgi:predicted PurR-regulated permease PerM
MQGQERQRDVSPRLRQVSDNAWRLLVVGLAAYVVFLILMRFELVFVSLFIALIITSLLRPPVNGLSKVLPRPLSVVLAALAGLALIAGIFTWAGTSVAGESNTLGNEFHGGLVRIEKWLEGKPFHVNPHTLANLQGKLTSYVEAHRTTLINQALNGAGRIVDVLTVLALAVFCSIFFTSSGDRMWHWFQEQLPDGVRPTWVRCGQTAWHTFAGYTRGIILVAAANAIMVGVSLKVLGVPLVLPLTILEFVASFIPLAGSPIAMAVATVVALASKGVTTAIIVLVLIVVFGQIEGHVLQPFVMGWAVRLHPVAVAVSVIAGTISAGLLGAVVAVPLVSIAWAVARELRLPAAQLAPAGAAAAEPGPLEPPDPARAQPAEPAAVPAQAADSVGQAEPATGLE